MDTSRLRRATGPGAIPAAALFAATGRNGATGYSAATTPASQVRSGAATPSAGGGPGTTGNSQLATPVTDAAKKTPHRYDRDRNGPPTSNRTNGRATTWPPVAAISGTQVKGVDQSLLGNVQRPAGTRQLTVGGRPGYRHSGDKAAGDINGQEMGGVWYAAASDGTRPGESSTGTGTAGAAATTRKTTANGTTTPNGAADTSTTTKSDDSDYDR